MNSILIGSVVLCALCTFCVQADQKYLDDLWETFKISHSKVYTASEEKVRRQAWEENVKKIQLHNLEYDLGMHSFTLGLNKYADLTPSEYRRYLLGETINSTAAFTASLHVFNYHDHDKAPDTKDWRQDGYVTAVKDQGQCGSCWSFSTTGATEGQYFKKKGKLVSLSEQNLVDCSSKYGNMGCKGGLAIWTYGYIKDNGIMSEKAYPYVGKQKDCKFVQSQVVTRCTGYKQSPTGDEAALKTMVASVGPIAVGIDAGQASFRLYKSGVYDEPECSKTKANHAVLIVGYGTEDGQDYWLVKNSWGPKWGLDGYIKMSRNKQSQCAIALRPTYPLL
eukprot:GHVT01079566.1.p1 GENE.GHVT01079566.1~~GHVT01079566.1.p1  ORF type:complete len:335 (-),score=15.88 GHVT01079566.1:243-1247(-)